MSKAKRIIIFIITLMLIATMVFSAAFIVHESDHHCTGNGCYICKLINDCIATLNILGYIICAFFISAIAVHYSTLFPFYIEGFLSQNTLINLKVKLSC